MTNNPITKQETINFHELETILRDMMPKITQGKWDAYEKCSTNIMVNGHRGIATTAGYSSNMDDAERVHQENLTNASFIAHSPEVAKHLRIPLPWLFPERRLKVFKDKTIKMLGGYKPTHWMPLPQPPKGDAS